MGLVKHGSLHLPATTKQPADYHRLLLYINPRDILRGLILIGSLVAIGYLLQVTQFGIAINEAWIDTTIRGRGVSGEIWFLASATLFTAVGLPRQVIAFLGGYAFGFLWGCTLALLGTLAGCVVAFYYARLLGQSFVTTRFSSSINHYADFLHGNIFLMTLLLRLLPVGSNLVTNLIAGILSVPGSAFFAGSVIGFIPQTIVFALIGSGINLDPELRISIGVLLFVVSGMLGVWLYRKYYHSKMLSTEFEHEIPSAPERDKN